MQNPPFPSATFAEFYRLAVLLTGNSKSAEQVIAEILAEADPGLTQLRSETSRLAWMAGRIRERCLRNQNGGVPAPRLLREPAEPSARLKILPLEAYLVAQRFHVLPEPERSALALFYLELFSVPEISQLLQMGIEELSETLARARAQLEELLSGTPAEAPAAA